MASEINFQDPKYYENRELSWLKFDYRILYEARDKENPLFERLKFLMVNSIKTQPIATGIKIKIANKAPPLSINTSVKLPLLPSTAICDLSSNTAYKKASVNDKVADKNICFEKE